MATAVPGRAPNQPIPQNRDAERSILGAIVLDNSAITVAAKALNSGDFFDLFHRRIFARMLAMTDDRVPIDLVTLHDALRAAGELRDEVQTAYLAKLIDGVPHVSNVEHYAKIVKEASARRAVIHLAEKLTSRAWEGEETVTGLVISAQATLATITASAQQIVTGNGKLTYSGSEFILAEFPTPEHLIPGLIPKNGSAMILAMPHHLKTWFTLALTMGPTRAGLTMGKLEVPKPVRTLLVTVEDFPGDVQWRMRQLLRSEAFQGVDMEAFRVLPRPVGGIDIMQEAWLQRMLREIDSFKPDHVIFDVLRRLFRGDINSPKESSALCEQVDRIRDDTGVATTVVHHENRKGEDIMRASAGSFNFPAWANVLIRFLRKAEEEIDGHKVSHVEIEVDNKLASSPDPLRMVLDLASETPLRLEPLEDVAGVRELRGDLGSHWSVEDLAKVLGVHSSNAKRRLKKLIAADLVEKIAEGKRGRQGGLARFRFVGEGE